MQERVGAGEAAHCSLSVLRAGPPFVLSRERGPVWGQARGLRDICRPLSSPLPLTPKAVAGAGGCSEFPLPGCPGPFPTPGKEGPPPPAEEVPRWARAAATGLPEQGLPLFQGQGTARHTGVGAAPRRCCGVPFTAGVGGVHSPYSLLLMTLPPPSCPNPRRQHRSV